MADDKGEIRLFTEALGFFHDRSANGLSARNLADILGDMPDSPDMKIRSYEGKNILVVGAGLGIGGSHARFLKESGANVLLTASSEDSVDILVKKYGFEKNKATVFDVNNENNLGKLKGFVQDRFDGLDGIIYTPAKLNTKYFGFGPEAKWENVGKVEKDLCLNVTYKALNNIVMRFIGSFSSEGSFVTGMNVFPGIPGYTIAPAKKKLSETLKMLSERYKNVSFVDMFYPPVLTKASLPIFASYDFVMAVAENLDVEVRSKTEYIYEALQKLAVARKKPGYHRLDVGGFLGAVEENQTKVKELADSYMSYYN